MSTIGEEELGEFHIFRRSIYPLVFRLVLINLIFLAVIFFYILIIFSLRNTLDFGELIWINIFFLAIFQFVFAVFSIYITLKWLSEIYVIQFPNLITKKGILEIEEKHLTVQKSQNVQIQQSALGKFFDYGNVKIQSASSEGDLEFFEISRPSHMEEIFKE